MFHVKHRFKQMSIWNLPLIRQSVLISIYTSSISLVLYHYITINQLLYPLLMLLPS